MARFNGADIDNYGGQGGAGYFSLKNDKDVAQVRFMYNTADDVDGYAVHEVYVNDKKRYVNCLRAYNEPIENCPFCRERKPQQVKLFIPLYDVDEERIKVWERGKKFYATLSGIFARTKGKIVSNVFEIERNGKPGDTQTTYGIYPVDKDDTTLEDLPEVPEVLGGILLDKSVDDMEYYLEQGSFPPEDNSDDIPVRRRRTDDDDDNRNSGRRTPATNRSRRGNGNGDAF